MKFFEFTKKDFEYIVEECMLDEEYTKLLEYKIKGYSIVKMAQYNGTLFDQRNFVLWYLDSNYERVTFLPKTVGDVAREYPNNIILCTMKGHICCIKYGVIYDTFDPSERFVEYAWFVE